MAPSFLSVPGLDRRPPDEHNVKGTVRDAGDIISPVKISISPSKAPEAIQDGTCYWQLSADSKELDEYLFGQLQSAVGGAFKTHLDSVRYRSCIEGMLILHNIERLSRVMDLMGMWDKFVDISVTGDVTEWYTSVLASWNDFNSRRITPEIFFLLQVYKQIKPVSELAVSKLSTILNDSFENNSPVNVTDVLLELSKVLMVSESAVTPKFKADRAMTGANKTREPCKTCGRIHGGECWDLQTCGKCGETGHLDHRHDAVMRQRGEQDKAKQHAERKGRTATTKKALKAVDSDDSSPDTDVGSELAALSASFADAVPRP